MLFKDLDPTSVFFVQHAHTGHTTQMEFIYVGEGSLILILHVLISDFNPVWSAYVWVAFPSPSSKTYNPKYPLFLKVCWVQKTL